MTLPLGDSGRPGGGGTGLPLRDNGLGAVDAGASVAADAVAVCSGGRPLASGRALEMTRDGGAGAGCGAGAATGMRPSAAATTASAALIGAGAGVGSGAGAGCGAGLGAVAGAATGAGALTGGIGSAATGGAGAGSSATGTASTGASATGVSAGASAGVSAGASTAGSTTSAASSAASLTVDPVSTAAVFLAGAFLAAAFFFAAVFFAAVFLTGFTSSGCSSRVNSSRSARRITMSAYASASDDEGPFAATPSTPQRPRTSAFVIPRSLASSWILIFFAATLRFNLSQSSFPRRCVNECTSRGVRFTRQTVGFPTAGVIDG